MRSEYEIWQAELAGERPSAWLIAGRFLACALGVALLIAAITILGA